MQNCVVCFIVKWSTETLHKVYNCVRALYTSTAQADSDIIFFFIFIVYVHNAKHVM